MTLLVASLGKSGMQQQLSTQTADVTCGLCGPLADTKQEKRPAKVLPSRSATRRSLDSFCTSQDIGRRTY